MGLRLKRDHMRESQSGGLRSLDSSRISKPGPKVAATRRKPNGTPSWRPLSQGALRRPSRNSTPVRVFTNPFAVQW